MRRFALIATLLVAGADLKVGPYARQAPQEPPPTFRAGVEAVQLSVIVTDSEGNPVPGLTVDDFEILENKIARPITTFSAVDIPIEGTQRATVRRDVLSNDGPPGRLYVIAFDDMNETSALRARAFLRQFIEKYFGPNDTAAVMLITRGMRESGQEFTSDPRLLLQAIDKFSGGMTGGPADWIREKSFAGDLRSLMTVMATLRGGRKAVILLSGRLPAEIDPYRVTESRSRFLGGLFSDINPEVLDALSYATRNNIAIYPVDPAGLATETTAPESFDTSGLEAQMALRGLAEVTGGFALTGSNNYDGAFERLVRENSTYYLLAFNSGVEQRDGRYVGVEVRVKRPGLQVRSTGGYVAPRGKPPEQRRPSTVLAATWDAVTSAITTSGVPMRVYAAPFKSRAGGATVAISVEVTGSRLNLVDQDGAYRGLFEVMFAVTDAKKRKFPIWRHRVELKLKPETYQRVSTGAMRVVSQLRLPEGHYQLRTSAGNAAVAGSVIYDFEVPDFQKDFSVSGVALTSAQASRTFTFSPPPGRIDVGLPGPPTTAREFSRDDTLTLFAEAYENRRKPHVITFTVELRDDAGRKVGSYVIEGKSAEKPKEATVYKFAPNLPLQDIPPGRYALHIEGRSSLDKDKPITREIPFTVR
jgi:VWFA-related protein